MSRKLYHRQWIAKHEGYKTACSRRKALFTPAKRPFYREILGERVQVNLLATVPRGPLYPHDSSGLGHRPSLRSAPS